MDKAQPSELVERLRAVEQKRLAFERAREAMNAARPDPIHATRAERALYDERYQADNQAEREYRIAALELACGGHIAEAADLIERLTPTPEPCRVREALVEARTVCEMVTKASMSESRPSRGESSIGWQKGDGADALSVRKAAREAIAKIDSALSASPAEPEEATEAMIDELHVVIWEAGKSAQPLEDHPISPGSRGAFQYGKDCATANIDVAVREAITAMRSAAPIEKREEGRKTVCADKKCEKDAAHTQGSPGCYFAPPVSPHSGIGGEE